MWEISENGDGGWYYLTSTSNDFPIGANEKEITIPATAKYVGSTEGKFIRVWIQFEAKKGTDVFSNVLGPIQP